MTIRETAEAREKLSFSSAAMLSSNSQGRAKQEQPCLIRTCFERDKDRIIHSSAFRRLKHKTQVFLSPEGDYYRTRLTHTLEVSQIARTISRALNLNEDLTEAIALAHDLGHTPFGHAGEHALNNISPEGFRHFEQSVRVVNILEKDGEGLNLTFEVIDGILNHTRGTLPKTLEGRVVRIADRIAYMNHDIDDAVRAGIFENQLLPTEITNVLGDTKSKRIDTLVKSVIFNSKTNEFEQNLNEICMADDVKIAFDSLHKFLFNTIYVEPLAKAEESKVDDFISRLFAHFVENPTAMPLLYQKIADISGAQRAASDYIAGMTDRYAVNIFHDLFIPKGFLKRD